MLWLALTMTLVSTEPTEKQLALLKTFREEFVAISPGKEGFPVSFQMGSSAHPSEQPVHAVAFNGSFLIAKYEVPQNLWEAVMGSNPSKWKGPRNSVEMLSFDEAVAFCTKATELMRSAKLIADDDVIRLPTEAEWEYCTRAGTTTAFSFGDNPQDLNDYGWHTGNAAGNDPPVGAKRPNPWKLYDVHGYLWEWCADAWHDNYSGAPSDGSAWKGDSTQRVLRGGSWKDKAERATSTARIGADKSRRDDNIGLRCVLSK